MERSKFQETMAKYTRLKFSGTKNFDHLIFLKILSLYFGTLIGEIVTNFHFYSDIFGTLQISTKNCKIFNTTICHKIIKF